MTIKSNVENANHRYKTDGYIYVLMLLTIFTFWGVFVYITENDISLLGGTLLLWLVMFLMRIAMSADEWKDFITETKYKHIKYKFSNKYIKALEEFIYDT